MEQEAVEEVLEHANGPEWTIEEPADDAAEPQDPGDEDNADADVDNTEYRGDEDDADDQNSSLTANGIAAAYVPQDDEVSAITGDGAGWALDDQKHDSREGEEKEVQEEPGDDGDIAALVAGISLADGDDVHTGGGERTGGDERSGGGELSGYGESCGGSRNDDENENVDDLEDAVTVALSEASLPMAKAPYLIPAWDGMVDGGGHARAQDRGLLASLARVGAVGAAGLVLGVPWALARHAQERLTSGGDPSDGADARPGGLLSDAMDEEEAAARRVAALARFDPYAVRGEGWALASRHLSDDVVRLLGPRSPLGGYLGFGAVRWSFPEAHAVDGAGRGIMALTVDDAPGDNPAEFARLLDALAAGGARATFFCTTRTITPATAPLLARAAAEGHELANHCPEDRNYARCSPQAFDLALREAHEVRGLTGDHCACCCCDNATL